MPSAPRYTSPEMLCHVKIKTVALVCLRRGSHDVIQDGVLLSCGGSAGPTCLALRQDDAQQKNKDDRTVNGTKGITWRGFGAGENAFEGAPQWQHHSQLDYNRYYATGF